MTCSLKSIFFICFQTALLAIIICINFIYNDIFYMSVINFVLILIEIIMLSIVILYYMNFNNKSASDQLILNAEQIHWGYDHKPFHKTKKPKKLTFEEKLLRTGKINVLESDTVEYKKILTFFEQSQFEEQLKRYGWDSLRHLVIYKVNQPSGKPQSNFTGEKLLLWHGSGKRNWMNIVKAGLKLPRHQPREQSFGRGIYFADRVTKSAQYCQDAGGRKIIEGRNCVFLCEVSVGPMYNQSKEDPTVVSPPKGFGCIKFEGNYEACPTGDIRMPNGTIVKAGITQTNPKVSDSTVLSTEYIVYDENRVELKYIVAYEPVKK